MFRAGSTRKTRCCRFRFRISRIKNVINKKRLPEKLYVFFDDLWRQNSWTQVKPDRKTLQEHEESSPLLFQILLSYHTFGDNSVCLRKITIFSKFHLWWPLVISILSWPENGLGKTLRSCHFISNAVYHLSLSSEVFEIRWGFLKPPPRHKLNLLAPAKNRINSCVPWG